MTGRRLPVAARMPHTTRAFVSLEVRLRDLLPDASVERWGDRFPKLEVQGIRGSLGLRVMPEWGKDWQGLRDVPDEQDATGRFAFRVTAWSPSHGQYREVARPWMYGDVDAVLASVKDLIRP